MKKVLCLILVLVLIVGCSGYKVTVEPVDSVQEETVEDEYAVNEPVEDELIDEEPVEELEELEELDEVMEDVALVEEKIALNEPVESEELAVEAECGDSKCEGDENLYNCYEDCKMGCDGRVVQEPKYINCSMIEDGILNLTLENPADFEIDDVNFLVGNKPYRGFIDGSGIDAGAQKNFIIDYNSLEEEQTVSKIYGVPRKLNEDGTYEDCVNLMISFNPNVLCKEFTVRVVSGD